MQRRLLPAAVPVHRIPEHQWLPDKPALQPSVLLPAVPDIRSMPGSLLRGWLPVLPGNPAMPGSLLQSGLLLLRWILRCLTGSLY